MEKSKIYKTILVVHMCGSVLAKAVAGGLSRLYRGNKFFVVFQAGEVVRVTLFLAFIQSNRNDKDATVDFKLVEKLNQTIDIKIALEKEIINAIQAVYHGSDMEEQRLRDLVEYEIENDDTSESYSTSELSVADISGETEASKAPVINFVDLLLSQAVKCKASDIHIEPQEDSMDIRMRVQC